MRKMLLLTNADLGLNAGNTALIARRATELYREKNISTRCIIFEKNVSSVDKLKYEGITFEILNNKEELKTIIKQTKPEYVMFYGFKVLRFYRYVKKILNDNSISSQIIYDMQACNEEKIEYNESGLRGIIQFYLQKIIFKLIINDVDGCFVVTDELEEYCKNYLQKGKMPKFYKVRCGINKILSPKEIVENREKYRNIMGLSADDIVLVYSGFRSGWQKIDLIIDQFKKYDSLYENLHFCFFCNIDEEFTQLLKNSFPKNNYTLKFLTQEEYFGHLCACDIGFLIREENMTNRVAFPNKFSDYICSGLIIAINRGLKEPIRILEKYGVPYIDTDLCPNLSLEKIVNARNQDYIKFYKTNDLIAENEIMYSKQISALDI